MLSSITKLNNLKQFYLDMIQLVKTEEESEFYYNLLSQIQQQIDELVDESYD